MAYSGLWQDEQQRVKFAAECRTDEDQVVQPKLLVLLDTPMAAGPWETVRAELRRLVFQRGRGPMLELDASQPDWALVELRAALEAMR